MNNIQRISFLIAIFLFSNIHSSFWPFSTSSSNIILSPIKKSGEEVAFIVIPGAQLGPSTYVPLAEEVQKNSEYRLWVGIPKFTLDMPNPLEISSVISSTINDLKQKGMNTSKIFYGGHSLGGVIIQNHLSGNNGALGMVLMGSGLSRSFINSLDDSGHSLLQFKIPTLTLASQLDGLYRISRVAEALYHQNLNQANSTLSNYYPVVVVKGATHMQFSSGNPPFNVRANDLIPEISNEQAHSTFGSLIANFIGQINSKSKVPPANLQKFIEETKVLLNPVIEALQLEGSYHLKPACFDKPLINPPNKKCTHGSPWVENAQKLMGGISGLKNIDLNVNDNSHYVWGVDPVHLPQINNYCNTTQKCTLSTTTVSELCYESFDSMDTGFYSNTASEIKAKLVSRQQTFVHVGNSTASFDVDKNATCSEINKNSYLWAYNKIPEDVRKRFDSFGQKYEFGTDLGPYNVGPLWIWTYMSYSVNPTKTSVMVNSPYMATPIDYLVSAAAGFHYCKLLSPAKAVEWFYLDSLRENRGLKIKSSTISYLK